jgi:serine/threonine-protein kinase
MGLARLEQLDGTEEDETATGVTLGTFDYISPEQARNPREADSRSDIYSLGCTLFFMLTGRPPFAQGSVLQKLLLHQSEAPPDVRELRPEVPDMLAGIVATMLAKRPEDRFQNPAELAAALHGCVDQLGLSAAPHVMPYRSPLPGPTGGWRRHAAWLVPTVVLLAGVFVLGLKWHFATPPPQFPELQIPETIAPLDQVDPGASAAIRLEGAE